MTNHLIEEVARIVDTVRGKKPLIHCITNSVTVNDCANILLAFGASPAMCDTFDEAYEFARIASALYINVGTYNKEQETAAIQAVLGARQAGIPIVIDPVGCAAIPKRIYVLDHLYHVGGIDIIKGNMGEIMALGGYTADVKGVDSNGDIDNIEEAAISLAKQYHCTVAATGKADVITDGDRLVRVHNGVELLTKITGAGCMVGALCGAAAATAKAAGLDMFTAALAGIIAMGIAGEQAMEQTELPGSYRVALIDRIYTLTGSAIREKGTIQW